MTKLNIAKGSLMVNLSNVFHLHSQTYRQSQYLLNEYSLVYHNVTYSFHPDLTSTKPDMTHRT